MDRDEDDFVFYGTPIEREEEIISRKKKAVAEASGNLRTLVPWKQEVFALLACYILFCSYLFSIFCLVPEKTRDSEKSREKCMLSFGDLSFNITYVSLEGLVGNGIRRSLTFVLTVACLVNEEV